MGGNECIEIPPLHSTTKNDHYFFNRLSHSDFYCQSVTLTCEIGKDRHIQKRWLEILEKLVQELFGARGI